MIIGVLAAFISTIGFAVFFNVSKKEVIYCGAVGGMGWFIYLIALGVVDDKVSSSFIAVLVISILSHLLAKIRKNPITIYETSGILPLVPGAGMYKSLYYIVNEEYSLSTYYLYETLKIAGAIAVGMMLIASINVLLSKYN